MRSLRLASFAPCGRRWRGRSPRRMRGIAGATSPHPSPARGEGRPAQDLIDMTDKKNKTAGKDKPALTHIDVKGEARMVDVSAKPATERVAVAEGQVVMTKT